MPFVGMDVEDVDRIVTQLAGRASAIATLVGAVDGIVGTLVGGIWAGPDVLEFHSWWNGSHRPSLDGAHGQLTAMVSTLQEQVKDQLGVSGELPVAGATGIDGSHGASGQGHGSWGSLGSGAFGLLGGVMTSSFWTWKDGTYDFAESLLRAGGYFGSGNFGATAAKWDEWIQGKGWENGVEDSKLWTNMKGWAADRGISAFLDGDDAGFAKYAGYVNKLDQAAEVAGGVGKTVEVAGKVLGPVGAVAGVWSTVEDVRSGKDQRAAYEGISTGLGIAAMVTPPPADVVCGVAAGAMAAGELIYDHVPAVKDFVNDADLDVTQGAKAAVNTVDSFVKSLW